MITFLTLQEDVANQLREIVGTNGYWSSDEIKNAINDSYIKIAEDALCFNLKCIIQILSGIRIYKLPSNYISGSIRRVEFDSEVIYPVSSEELDYYSLSWKTDEGSEILNYLQPGDICDIDEISVYPIPDTDGTAYNTAVEDGIVTSINDEDFEDENGVIVSFNGDAEFVQESGAVQEILDPSGNLTVYASRYPDKMIDNTDVPLSPVSYNPNKIFTNNALAILFAKEGRGKDIAKASYYNKRGEEAVFKIRKPRSKRRHRINAIDSYRNGRTLNLGSNFPPYRR